MHTFPRSLHPLIYASLSTALIAVVLSAFNVISAPGLWVVPAAFVITVPFHSATLFLSRPNAHDPSRVFSLGYYVWALSCCTVWVMSLGIVTISMIFRIRKEAVQTIRTNTWLMVALSAILLIESILVSWIGIITRREMKKIAYSAKWRRNDSGSSSQPWSINRV